MISRCLPTRVEELDICKLEAPGSLEMGIAKHIFEWSHSLGSLCLQEEQHHRLRMTRSQLVDNLCSLHGMGEGDPLLCFPNLLSQKI